ncbi:hypothetical protein WUBG_00474 [Wuchereria bancrofti]|uniref:Uncharacterized protein n=1 Tax=Wuchereria bancrofti TaxID=6293 RepID=J9BM70_WUCBA|nr:hypothetical protein WUBG_00474 [Wuchereria bancrofti]
MTVRIRIENGFERITFDSNMYARQCRTTRHSVTGPIAVDGAAGEKNWSTGCTAVHRSTSNESILHECCTMREEGVQGCE